MPHKILVSQPEALPSTLETMVGLGAPSPPPAVGDATAEALAVELQLQDPVLKAAA